MGYSLYQYNFELQPKPVRSLFSFGNEASRAQLPDFQDVKDLAEFLERLFILKLPGKGIWTQVRFCASYVSLLLLVVMVILSARVYEKSFWIIRSKSRPSGTIFVPNSMLCFSLVEGIYGIIFVALLWTLDGFYNQRSQAPINALAWVHFIWIPLIFGASIAALGTYHAIPRQIGHFSGLGEERSVLETLQITLHSFVTHSWLINFAIIVVPACNVISIVIPTVYGNRLFNVALQQQIAWQHQYANLPFFSQGMITDAQHVWYDILPAMYMASITMIIWSTWALFIFVIYSFLALRLVLTIRHELQGVNPQDERFRGFAISDHADPIDVVGTESDRVALNGRRMAGGDKLVVPIALHAAKSHCEEARRHFGHSETSKRIQNTSSQSKGPDAVYLRSRGASLATVVDDHMELVIGKAKKEDQEDEKMHLESSRERERPESDHDNLSDILHGGFPIQFDEAGVIAMMKARENKNATSKHYRRDVDDVRGALAIVAGVDSTSHAKQTTRQVKASMRRKHALKKAFMHVCVQAIAIAPGCLIFLGVACSLAIGSYGGSEQPQDGGTLYEQVFACAVLLVCWTTVIFGSVILFAIAFRTYESIIIAAPSMAEQHTPARKFRLSTFTNSETVNNEPVAFPLQNLGQDSQNFGLHDSELSIARKGGRRRKLAFLQPSPSFLQNAGCASRDAEDEIGVESSYFETQSRQCPGLDVEQSLLQLDAIDPSREQGLDYNTSTKIGQRSGKETFEKPEKAVRKLSFLYDVEAQQLHHTEDEIRDSLIFH